MSSTGYRELRAEFATPNPPRRLFPLLWLHGDPKETEEVLRQEIKAMDEGGCGGFIIESRPHGDYLGPGWWRDVGICVDEAQRRDMEVWLFDEEYYPSGIAGGKVLEGHPEYRMKAMIRETEVWRTEPVKAASASEEKPYGLLNISEDWLEILSLSAAPYSATAAKSGARVVFQNGEELEEWKKRTTIEHPGSEWTLSAVGLKPTWSGRMFEKMVDYLDPEVTDRFIALTYETTRKRFGHLFGTVIKGFFGDETSFENFGSYDVLFGPGTPCMPWTRLLPETFRMKKGYELCNKLDLLWDRGEDEDSAKVRFDYMDVMTQLFADNFFGRIQSWCHANNMRFIGHVVEDNNAHMHHGYGVGHFFRTTRHFDMGGYDFVLRQIDPDQKKQPYTERYPQFRVYRDAPHPSFFHHTLAKLAQSAAHLEIGTDLVMCENFGAYGWDLTMSEMKWLTDWQTARGTNWYVPHAFSPLFPDPDCPPHFYAGGKNPLWPYFRKWADYANRSCLMLAGANHVADIAVLYPAESHWSGDDVLLDETCRTLLENQLDFDILSFDLLTDPVRTEIRDGMLLIGNEAFRTVVLPNIRTVPLAVMERLHAFALEGGHVIAIGGLPERECRGSHELVMQLTEAMVGGSKGDLFGAGFNFYGSAQSVSHKVVNSSLAGLPEAIDPALRDLQLTPPSADLRYAHYRRGETDIYFLHNESIDSMWRGTVRLQASGIPELWEPADGSIREAAVYDRSEACTQVWLELAPYEAVFVVLRHEGPAAQPHVSPRDPRLADGRQTIRREPDGRLSAWTVIPGMPFEIGPWRVAAAASPVMEVVPEPSGFPAQGNWLESPDTRMFSGTVTYEAEIQVKSSIEDNGLRFVLELGEVGGTPAVTINGTPLPIRLSPPYRFELPAGQTYEELRIEVSVANTLAAAVPDKPFSPNKLSPAGLLGPVRLLAYRTEAV